MNEEIIKECDRHYSLYEFEEAIEKLNYLKTIRDLKDYVKDNNCMLADAIDVVLKELEKKDKMIELMTDYMDDNIPYSRKTLCLKYGKEHRTQETIKQYFEKKVKEAKQ